MRLWSLMLGLTLWHKYSPDERPPSYVISTAWPLGWSHMGEGPLYFLGCRITDWKLVLHKTGRLVRWPVLCMAFYSSVPLLFEVHIADRSSVFDVLIERVSTSATKKMTWFVCCSFHPAGKWPWLIPWKSCYKQYTLVHCISIGPVWSWSMEAMCLRWTVGFLMYTEHCNRL